MARWQSLLVALVMIAGGFFEQGCTGFAKGAGGDAMEGLWEKGKELVKSEIAAAVPALEEKLLAVAEKKIAEREAKDLATIDAQLVLLATVDPITGMSTAKTSRDFDADHDGHLSPAEQLRVGAFITTEGWKRVQAGTMTKETFLGMEKTTGVSLASLLGGTAATAAIMRRRKDSATVAKPAGDPPKPSPAPPAAAPPKPA